MAHSDERLEPFGVLVSQSESGKIAVSYLLTTRNRRAFVEERIRNVREFIRPGDEFLIYDGGSTDGTAEMVARHRDVVTGFVAEPDRGEAHGFNKAILASRGDIIKVLTDDDHFYPDAMRRAVATMEENPDIDALICGGEAYFGSGPEGRFWVNFRLPEGVARVDLESVFLYLNCGLGLLFRRRIIPLVGLFDTTFVAVDTQYLAQMVRCGVNLRYMDVRLFKHTRHAHSTSGNEAIIQRDVVRALMDAGEWDMLFGFGRSFLQNAPGIERLRFGRAYLSVLTSLRRLEEAGVGRCVILVSRLLGGVRGIVRFFRKPWGSAEALARSKIDQAGGCPSVWSGRIV